MTAKPENEQHIIAEKEDVSQPEVLQGGRSAPSATMPSNGSSQCKIEANRRNALKSTGPRTPAGKARSAWNSLKHGLLSRKLFVTSKHDKRRFSRLLSNLRRDLLPVGTLEEVLVEKIAYEYWRLGKAAWQSQPDVVFAKKFPDLDLRYETTINRQLYQAINQLERLQRSRAGEQVPAPVNIQVTHDIPRLAEEGSTAPAP